MKQSENEPIIKGIAIGIGLLLVNLIFGLLIIITIEDIYFVFFMFLLFFMLLLLTYYLAGQYCGRHWPNPSWKWGFWLTIPLIVLHILLFMLLFIIEVGSVNVMLFSFGLDFVLLLTSSLGAIAGGKASPETLHQVLQNILNVKFLQNILNLIIKGIFFAIIPAFLVSFIGLLIVAYLIFNVFVYLFLGYKYGKRWPQLSWMAGIIFTLPWFVITYAMFWHPPFYGGDLGIVFEEFTIFGFFNLNVACIGAYFGAKERKKEMKI